MRALLLAAGLGTRLQPITNILPKCLVPISGKTLLDYWFEQLKVAGIERFLVNTHYMADIVEEHISRSPYADLADVIYEKELLNTGGTILANREFFGDEAFMVVHADNLSICDYSAFIESHKNRNRKAAITMMTFLTDNPRSCGIIELNSEEMVVRFHEKVNNPPSNLANGAVYIMEPEVIEAISAIKNSKIDFSLEIIPRYLGRINTFLNDRLHRDIGSIDSYAMAQLEHYMIAKGFESKKRPVV